MKTLKKTLCLVLCLALVLSLGAVAFAGNYDQFTDADKVGDAYVEAVDTMIGIGIIEGVTETELAPQGIYNRAQAAKIVAYMKLGPVAAEALTCSVAPFEDVAADMWAAKYIAYCAKEGIILGVGEGKFDPAGTLTGYQWGAMLLRAIGYGQNDEYTGNGWDVEVAKDAIPLGIYAGDITGASNKNLTREQAILFAFNTLNNGVLVSYSALLGTYIAAYDATLTGDTLGERIYGLEKVEGYVYFDNKLRAYAIDGVVVEAGEADVWRDGYVWTANGKAVSDVYYVGVVLGTATNGAGFYNWIDRYNANYVCEAEMFNDIYFSWNGAGTYEEDADIINAIVGYTDDEKAYVDGAADLRGAEFTFIDLDNDQRADEVYAIERTVTTITAPVEYKTVNNIQWVKVPGLTSEDGHDFYYEASKLAGYENLVPGDVILYYENLEDGITYIVKAEAVKGAKTAEYSNGTIQFAGNTYNFSELDGASATIPMNVPGTIYLDKGGYIVAYKADATVLEYAYLVKVAAVNGVNTQTETFVLFEDGTTVTAYPTYNNKVINPINGIPAQNAIYAYTYAGETLNLNNTAYDAKDAQAIIPGIADFAGVGIYADDATKFVYITYDANKELQFTPYVGVKNIPAYVGNLDVYYADTTGYAEFVVVDALAAAPKDVITYGYAVMADLANTKTVNAVGEDFYTYKDIDGNEILAAELIFDEGKGIYKVTYINGVAEDAVKLVATANDATDNYIIGAADAAEVIAKNANGSVVIDGVYYTYDAATVLYLIDAQTGVQKTTLAAALMNNDAINAVVCDLVVADEDGTPAQQAAITTLYVVVDDFEIMD